MFSFSADDLLKLPFLRTIVIVLTIVLCVCPGISMFYLHDAKGFNDMNIIKLLLVALSMNILFYIGSFGLVFMLTVIDDVIQSLTVNVFKEEVTVRIKNNIEKSVLVNNFMIIFCIALTTFSIILFKESFEYQIILKKISLLSYSFLMGWFAPNLFGNIIKSFKAKSPSEVSNNNNSESDNNNEQN